MKTIFLLFIIVSGITIDLSGQTMLTRRQVYDYNINDEFHYKNFAIPFPNARRLKVISKQLSNDTVYYSFHYDNYSANLVTSPSPHLEYQFSSGTNSVYYTDLDTLINVQFNNFPLVDSGDYFHDTLYYSSQFCGRLVYQYEGVTYSGFEPTYRSGKFGEGLGEILYYSYNSATPIMEINDQLFYYKKDTIICGTPDTLDSATVASVYEQEKLSTTVALYPNPTSSLMFFQTSSNDSFKILIYNSAGILVRRFDNILSNQAIDVSTFPKGFYFAQIESDKKVYQKKIIIE